MVVTKKVLAIYTGGTFGMLKNEKGVLVPQKNIEQVIRRLPQLHDNDYWGTKLKGTEHKEYLVLPDGKDTDLKVLYKILEYEELKDSSDFTLDDWIKMARDIKKYYHDYDGFVVLHGTDTTAYGASLLSFMMETVGKTVVLTGAQVPIFQPRSDGNNNFLCALLIAATQHIPEVTVFFGCKLFRGTRVKKVSNTKIYAFDTPNYPPLLEAKTTLEVDPKMLIHAPGSVPDECRIHDRLSRKVYVLKVAPTITPEVIRAVADGMEGLVLETYGNGNIPIKRKEIYQEIARAVKNQVLVVNVTQCINGTVLGKPLYETGLLLIECGVVPAFDMTSEAVWAKLCYVLSKTELSYEQKVEMMKTNIRGELYNPNHQKNGS
ncbi:L-asparaginase-like isoform X3 [Ostrinia furnacalis]|uniref:L-asparaginase-like isoform X2 n=1 Tax=Ostrinia furnacalis TaxID=93504 RepID=UPI001039667F|nr:L-asparaginase-like isoform X2 [Ostrinia furnacalis]XP_028172955.1 L-asparaginase-like isoform X3 [Ostrinia furnacalis]